MAVKLFRNGCNFSLAFSGKRLPQIFYYYLLAVTYDVIDQHIK